MRRPATSSITMMQADATKTKAKGTAPAMAGALHCRAPPGRPGGTADADSGTVPPVTCATIRGHFERAALAHLVP